MVGGEFWWVGGLGEGGKGEGECKLFIGFSAENFMWFLLGGRQLKLSIGGLR